MIRVNKCLICDHSDFKCITRNGFLFSGERVMLCASCGMLFLSPRMTQEESEHFYKSNRFSKEFRGNDTPNREMIKYREERAERRFNLLSDSLLNIPEGPILEIGCSSGNFLKLLAKRGYDVYGIDPSKGFAEYAAKEYGLKVITGIYPEDLPEEFNGPFAAVSAFQVLEHTPDPYNILKSVIRHMKKNGLLFLEIPDVERAVTHRKYIHHEYFQKSHLWDFRLSTITLLLKSCGFQVNSFFYDTKPPYDKNLMIIANPYDKSSNLPEESSNNSSSLSPQHLLRLLKIKLFLGHLVRYSLMIFRKKGR